MVEFLQDELKDGIINYSRRGILSNKITWDEIKKIYPDEWVSLHNCEKDPTGLLVKAEVFAHSKNRKDVFELSTKAGMFTNLIDFTGIPSTFLGFCRWEFTNVKTGK